MTSWPARVKERLRSPLLDALAEVPGVWLVGGAVRDALLGREPRELDLVVEGDAVAVARRLGGVQAVHERFGTATVPGADLATARTETYPRPGALPEVRLGATVREDLARRDVTVNALAVRLADGTGAAWPGALEDLDARRLRVLHDGSFRDDPTRLLRVARYAARLGFGIEPHTRELAREAIAAGAPATVTASRLGTELRLLLAEPLPRALVLLGDRDGEGDGLGRAVVHPAFHADEALLRRIPSPLGQLGACLLDAPPDGLRVRLAELAFPAGERDAVLAAAGARALAAALNGAPSASVLAAAARRAPEAALDVAAALGAREPVRRWREELRHVALHITGEDLLAAGLSGPAVGAGLRAALDAALDGRAPDRETQLTIATKG